MQPPPSLTIPAERTVSKTHSDAYGWYVVGVLMFTLAVAYVDRQILSLLVGPIKLHFGVSDTHIGLLAGFAFALFYTVLGVPIARLSDRYNRIAIISVGVIVWTFMTAACGLANSFAMLFLARVGVGIGEAALGPAAYSVIADYFPPEKVARAIGVYVAGLYLGVGFAMIGGSIVVQSVGEAGTHTLPLLGELRGWQIAFVVASVPGVVALALLATVREPPRRYFATDGSTRSAAENVAGWRELWTFFRSHRRFLVCLTLGAAFVGTIIMAYLVWTPEMMRRTHAGDAPARHSQSDACACDRVVHARRSAYRRQRRARARRRPHRLLVPGRADAWNGSRDRQWRADAFGDPPLLDRLGALCASPNGTRGRQPT